MLAKLGASFWRTKWGWLYLALIPAFAFAFDLLPATSLRDSNVIYEKTFTGQAERFVHELEADLASRVSRHGTWREGGITYELVPGSFHVGQVRRPVNEKVLMSLNGAYVGRLNGVPIQGQYVEHVELPTDSLPIFAINAHTEHQLFDFIVERSDPPTAPGPPLSLLLPPPQGSKIESSRAGTFGISFPIENEYARFVAAAEGDPHSLTGRYWRMLYLSATTITTLGFGDITPTSGLARFLVAFEAVAGIVCIGLFLNALAGRALRARSQPT